MLTLKIQRTFSLLDSSAFHGMGINHGGSDIAMPQQFLNSSDVIIGQQQMAGKTVPESMRGDTLRYLSGFHGPPESLLDPGGMDMITL